MCLFHTISDTNYMLNVAKKNIKSTVTFDVYT